MVKKIEVQGGADRSKGSRGDMNDEFPRDLVSDGYAGTELWTMVLVGRRIRAVSTCGMTGEFNPLIPSLPW